MEAETPISYYRFKSRPTNRQLWPKNKKEDKLFKDLIDCVNIILDPWDKIDSPQFIDFFDLPEISDEFFETKNDDKPLKHNPEAQKLPQTSDCNDRNELIKILDNLSLKKENKQLDVNINKDKKKKHLIKQCIKVKQETTTTTNENKKNITEKVDNVVKPFSFDLRNKCKQQQQKNVKEDKELHVFQAKPVARSIKTNVKSKSDHTIDGKLKNSNKINTEKCTKKSTEVWKKSPFLPCPVKKILKIPKSPPLLTAIRAKERKRFEEKLKEKEKEMEILKSLTAITEKKLEKKEMTRLRKQTVHNAQPIPKYISCLRQIDKRPLTEPLSPFNHKRRRRI